MINEYVVPALKTAAALNWQSESNTQARRGKAGEARRVWAKLKLVAKCLGYVDYAMARNLCPCLL